MEDRFLTVSPHPLTLRVHSEHMSPVYIDFLSLATPLIFNHNMQLFQKSEYTSIQEPCRHQSTFDI